MKTLAALIVCFAFWLPGALAFENNATAVAPRVSSPSPTVASASDTVLQVLAWTAYADTSDEYPNTVAAIRKYFQNFKLATSTTTNAAQLATQLSRRKVLLIPEQEKASSATLRSLGSRFGTVLKNFATGGGTVIVLCEWDWYQGFLKASGLLTAAFALGHWDHESFFVDTRDHPLSIGLQATIDSADAAAAYRITSSDAQIPIKDAKGNAVAVSRSIGKGRVVLIGYDFHSYNDDAARLIANAVQWKSPLQMKSGFYYPLGTAFFDSKCGTWLARDKANGGCYTEGYYHIGIDMQAPVSAPVYAIAKGKVVQVNRQDWGRKNAGVLVRHTRSSGEEFLALYGHVRTSVKAGDTVSAGVQFARVGPLGKRPRLHFGIYDGDTAPELPWNRQSNDLWPSTNGFVEPMEFLKTYKPK